MYASELLFADIKDEENLDEAFENQCLNWFDSLAPHTAGRYVIDRGFVWFVNIYKTDDSYGAFERVMYKNGGGAIVEYASIYGKSTDGKHNFTGWIGASMTTHNHDDRYRLEHQDCSNTDLNNLKTPGNYYGYTGMKNAKLPDNISIIEVVTYSYDWLVQRQTVITPTGLLKYERHFHSGTTWTAWVDADSMKREFNSGAIYSTKYTTPDNGKCKFYIVTVQFSETYTFSITVDCMSLQAAGGTRDFYCRESASESLPFKLTATLEGNSVKFDAVSGKILHVCGYY